MLEGKENRGQIDEKQEKSLPKARKQENTMLEGKENRDQIDEKQEKSLPKARKREKSMPDALE